MTFARLASPLHAARAGVAALWCLALATAVLAAAHPLVLGALALALAGAALGAGVGSRVARTVVLGLPFAALIVLVNGLVVRDGLTVVLRLGEVPVLGQVDVTAEALAYGAVLGARAVVVLGAAGALLAAVVDPDELLRALRRVSVRGALTAALATRLVPVLARDARRLAAAQRLRSDGPSRPGPRDRVAVARAVVSGALDRAVDMAATLEVRGYGVARRSPALRRPWSRHDVAFAASALALVALVAGAAVAGVGRFAAYPALSAPTGPAEVALALALVAVALAPFADRRGIGR